MANLSSQVLVKAFTRKYLWAALILITFITILTLHTATLSSSNVGSLLSSSRSYGTALQDGKKNDRSDCANNATLGFERIFAISLPERTDHRDGLLLASKLSGIDVNIIDGIHGDAIKHKSLPGNRNKNLASSVIGAWRAHINALDEVVRQDLSSALIMEDDVDWDIRLKSILQDYALSSRALVSGDKPKDYSFTELPSTNPPNQHSPYGDGWDVLWLGHCQMHLPETGIVTHPNDTTVPEDRHLRSFIEGEATPLTRYPPHTRAIFRGVPDGTCSLAYAVTQSAARNILFEVGIDKLSDPFDLMLRGWCEQQGRVCLGVIPQLFDHYRRAGPEDVDSDISPPHEKPRTDPFTLNIRWSVHMNMKKLLRGEKDYDDQYPDSS
ncbi:MAG: hypothetical protein M1831_001541 [Alyxoria varia]|nr:MAG: hypothetical protein M1831_001541 [Alyxoria varia]